MSAVKFHSDYDPWARIYNESHGPRYCEKESPFIEKLLQQHEGAAILDLCCGTGQMVQHLLSKGYRVTGLDSSQAMLHYARQNAPSAKFILDDARSFNLPPTFHAVICQGASLNHILSLKELKCVFQNVYGALLQNGIFLLGLHLEESYNSWNGSITNGDIKDNYAWAARTSYSSEEKIAQFQVTIFQLVEKYWQRSDILYEVKAYHRAEILSALESAGFTEISVRDSEGSFVEPEYNDYAIITCHKRLDK